MTRLCLDTSGYSRFRTGDARAVELLDGATWVGVPAILLGELRSGFLGGDRRAWNEQALAEFLANPAVEVLPVTDEVARHYAEIVVDLRRRGTPIPTNDIWIAATAANAGAPILCDDQHFLRVARVGSIQLGDG